MARDTSLLVSVSPKFTEETLRDILVKLTGNEGAEVTGWSVAPAAAKGDNYLSVVHRVTVNGRVNGSDVEYPIVVKALPRNKRRNEIFRSNDFFKNETAFYTKVVSLFEEFLKSKGKSDLLNVPRCLAYVDDGENNYLALEDVKTKGFNHIPRQKAWNVEDCKIIFKGFARYHGIALALWHQRPSEFINATKHLTEALFAEKFWKWYGTFYSSTIDIAKDAMTREYKGTPQERRFSTVTGKELFFKCVELVERKDKPILIVNHGDSWATNFMTRTLPSGEQDAVIFDFQLARCASPIHDLAYFVTTTTDKETRDKHFHNLLKYYHTELGKTLTLLGSNIDEVYSWDLFMKEVKEQWIFGLAFGLETLPASMLPESEAFDADKIKDDDDIGIGDIWKLYPIEDQENRRRVADVVKHAIDEGFL